MKFFRHEKIRKHRVTNGILEEFDSRILNKFRRKTNTIACWRKKSGQNKDTEKGSATKVKKRDQEDDHEQDDAATYDKIRREERVHKKLKKRNFGKKEEMIGNLSFIDPYKTETILEEEGGNKCSLCELIRHEAIPAYSLLAVGDSVVNKSFCYNSPQIIPPHLWERWGPSIRTSVFSWKILCCKTRTRK
jgi:hypothetical protein